jgi:hypothetical protein
MVLESNGYGAHLLVCFWLVWQCPWPSCPSRSGRTLSLRCCSVVTLCTVVTLFTLLSYSFSASEDCCYTVVAL